MNVLIVGGGICGLGTALLLARDGHEVTVLERDADAMPGGVDRTWDDWTRKGVTQFRQPHNLMPGLRLLLETELPEVQEGLRLAGAGRLDLLNPLPPFFTDRSPRPIDEKLWTLTARRPVGEWVFAVAAQNEPGVTIERGRQVTALLPGASAHAGIPHVAGVRTADGDEFRADLVIDASGRQSHTREWLAALGARPLYEEQADCGFAYYTRYFHGTEPARVGPVLAAVGTISILTLPADNNTWSVTVFTAAGDHPLKRLRFEQSWTRTVRACPLHAHWLDGEATTDVLPMSGIVDRFRRFVVDGLPIVTGYVAVGDAWACTNPSAGRGMTVGMLHALRLRDVLRETRDDPNQLVEEFHRRTEAEIAPWYHAQIAVDRARSSEMEALREGRERPLPADRLANDIFALFSTMGASPDLFRAGVEYVATVTPVQDVLQRPEVQAGMRAMREAMQTGGRLPPPPAGPNRQQLLELVG